MTKEKRTLEDLTTVELPTQGTYKFIVVEISDGANNKKVLVGSPNYGYHADIADAYSRKLPDGITMRCPCGGGRIRLTDKEIYAYGHSGSYGTAPQDLVEELLRNYAKDKGLQVKVEMGVGY